MPLSTTSITTSLCTMLCLASCNRTPAPNRPSAAELPAEVLRSSLIGDWVDEETHALCYRIYQRVDGKVVIEVPMSKVWRSEFRNIRYGAGTLSFDAYHHASSSDDYKTITNPSGDHPFSGVRCETTMRTADESPDVIVLTVKTVHAPEGITGRLLRRVPEK